jgi:hypothetical protein
VVAAVFDVAEPSSRVSMEAFLALLDDLRAWTDEGCITSHDSAQTAVGRRHGEGLLMRVVGTPEGIERRRFRLGTPVFVGDSVCDACFAAPAAVISTDSYEGSLTQISVCEDCADNGRASTMPARERALIPTVVEHWASIGRRTDPADHPAAEAAIRTAYAVAGRPPPTTIWLESYLAGALVASTIDGVLRVGMGWPVPPGSDDALVDLAHRAGWMLTGGTGLVGDALEASARPTVPPLVWKRLSIDVGRRVGQVVRNGLTQPVQDEVHHVVDAGIRGEAGADGLLSRSWAAAVEQVQSSAPWFRSADFEWSRVRDTVWLDPAGERRRVGIVSSSTPTEWLARVDFLRRSGRFRRPAPSFDVLERLSQACGSWWAFGRLAILTERPVVIRSDDGGWAHGDAGPAVEYRDGFTVHAWHGQRVSQRVVTEPAHITPADIDAERNVEVRLVLVERYGGWDRYLAESGAVPVHHDECGSLWRKAATGDEPIQLLVMENATARDDGTRSVAVLGVPPNVGTARAALAWTFGLDADAYRPVEST